MNNTKYLLIILVFSPLVVSAQMDINLLQGKWKMEGRESYEVWEKEGTGLRGYAYKMKDGQQIIKETLKIQVVDESTVYIATVPDQNNGAGIPFMHNKEETDLLSFENLAHDFPVKIRYKTENKDRLFVEVLGADGKGFSYYMDRVEL